MDAVATARPGLGRQGWNFVRHFLEMCISMCVGGYGLYLLIFIALPGVIGGPNLREQVPELSLILIATALTLPMAAWMLFRGMEWRPTLEMSAVAFALAIALLGLAWLGAPAESTLQIKFGSFCGIACVGMIGVMLFRLDLYTGRTGHHSTPGAQAAHVG